MKNQIEEKVKRVCNQYGLTYKFTNESRDKATNGEAAEEQSNPMVGYCYHITKERKEAFVFYRPEEVEKSIKKIFKLV